MLTVEHCDVTAIRADVLALKYAQTFYGADAVVAASLGKAGIPESRLRRPAGQHAIVRTGEAIAAGKLLIIGVRPLNVFSYEDIRAFARDTLKILAIEAPGCIRLATTLHGVGFGLDEIECIQYQIRGYRDAIAGGTYPRALQSIATGRVTRGVAAAAPEPAAKERVFVAMPFAREMRDVWTFGIQQPVREAGFLCERMEEAAFLGDVVAQIKSRIESAFVVVADLTGLNANVFLEVGYAWGKGRSTILLVRKGFLESVAAKDLPFDVRGHRHIVYEDATDLQEQLAALLHAVCLSPRTP